MADLFEDTGAMFSNCKKYRFALWRIWDKEKSTIMFIGLNPSTANETTDDPTIRRVKGFARDWGFGGVYMMNCFPYVSTNPDDLIDFNDNESNDLWLQEIGSRCSTIVFAWGSFEVAKKRVLDLVKMFPNAIALKKNADGSPGHPLYIPANTIPVKFNQ